MIKFPRIIYFKNNEADLISAHFCAYLAEDYLLGLEQFKHNNINRFEKLVINIQISYHDIIIEVPYRKIKT